MRMFSWQEIKEAGDCVAYLKSIGTPVRNEESGGRTRFRYPPWRTDSDSGGFYAWKDGWKDCAKDESGSILDACARAEFGGDIWQAQERLGLQLNLTVTNEKPKVRRKIAKVYDYTDLDGNVRHQTVRYEPKEFRQRRPDPDNEGKFIWSLDGVEPILYGLENWQGKSGVFIVGGEKDADALREIGLAATTNAGGEGHWKEAYNQHFSGKRVIILPDNDATGEKHAAEVARNLVPVAKGVRILRLPGLQAKGDVTDWIDSKDCAPAEKKKMLMELCKTADKPGEGGPAPEPEPKKAATEKEKAKSANAEPFANYRLEPRETPTGTKYDRKPIPVMHMLEEIRLRFCEFPRRIGGILFDHDHDTGNIRYIRNHIALQSWIQEKSKHPVMWSKIEGAVSQEQLYTSLLENSHRYDMISATPTWPERENVYYTFNSLPKPHKDAKHFYEFCDFFCPASAEDRMLLEAFVASPIFYEPKEPRPLWVIDAQHGQGTGKTILVEMVAALYGDLNRDSAEPIWVNQRDFSESQAERCDRRILSPAGREKKILLIDNVTGYFDAQKLAQWITQGSISGMAPYGRGEETRQNDLTYVLTSNSATLGRDLISRAIFIELKKPDSNKGWIGRVRNYIQRNRLNIFADIKMLLDKGTPPAIAEMQKSQTRYGAWEWKILAPILQDFDSYNLAIKSNANKAHQADGEQADGDAVRDTFVENLKKHGCDPENDRVWIHTKVATNWAIEAVPGIGGKNPSRSVPHILRNFAKTDMVAELQSEPRLFRAEKGGERKRGIMWIGSIADPEKRAWVVSENSMESTW